MFKNEPALPFKILILVKELAVATTWLVCFDIIIGVNCPSIYPYVKFLPS